MTVLHRVVALLLALTVGCSNVESSTPIPTTPGSSATGAVASTSQVDPRPEPQSSDATTVLAVADLTDCRGPDVEVAALVDSLDGLVLTPGDLAYRDGSAEDFAECFSPLYGDDLDRLYASPGDNDYKTTGADPFFDVMSGRPGERGKGWFAVEIGTWQLIVLNSNCAEVGGCDRDSEQFQWLDETLQAQPFDCRIVMWHHPRFTSSANYSGIPAVADFYGRLHGAGADILLVGHSHHYERLGPLAPDGQPADDGIMNFTIGVGGAPFTEFGDPRPGSVVRSNQHRGVLRLTLADGSYEWEFVNTETAAAGEDGPLVDQGSSPC